jgi:hypothetical protein
MIESAALVEMNEPIALAYEKPNRPGQPVLEILVIIFVETAIQIHIIGTAMHIDGRNIGPGDDNEIARMDLGPAEDLPGNKPGILVSLNPSLDHDRGARPFSLDEMNPQRVLGVLEKHVLSVFRLISQTYSGKKADYDKTIEERQKGEMFH